MNQLVIQEPSRAVAVTTPADLLRMVVEQNAPMEKIEKMLELQERWEANQARKAFNAAMAKFRESHIRVLRSQEVAAGPLKGTSYAKLSDFVNAAAPALSDCGLSASWKITKDEREWIEVACIIRHADGHQEETRMSGPPDVGGAKNAIQARASTVSYLEKYTFKMSLGLAEENDDDDGNGHQQYSDQQQGGQRQAAQAERQQQTENPVYPDADFATKLPVWTDLIASGQKPAANVIATVNARFRMTDEQKRTLNNIKVVAAAEAGATE